MSKFPIKRHFLYPNNMQSKIASSQANKLEAKSYKLGKRFLVRHIGNMGDHIFFIPPVLESLKKQHPNCHITLVTAWGFKEKTWKLEFTGSKWGLPRARRTKPWRSPIARKEKWGNRNQGGFCISLMMTNPHIDQLIHWHDTKTSLEGNICQEEGQNFPTWSKKYYEEQKESGNYDEVFELDMGITMHENPLQKLYETIGLPEETFTDYKIYFTEQDRAVAKAVMHNLPSPRIVLLEGIDGSTTRGWDPHKIKELEQQIEKKYGTKPLWFGGRHIPEYKGRPLTLRENIATLTHCDVGIGVLSGPLHFAVAADLPTITLYCDHSFHRAAPAYFKNPYITDGSKKHRTILGPTPHPMTLMKSHEPPTPLTPTEKEAQGYQDWLLPGKQSTKSCLAPITVDEVMTVLDDTLTL